MKAFIAYNAATEKIADKATKDLDAKMKVAMKASNLDLATTIKKQMDDISKGKVLAKLELAWKEELANLSKTPAKAMAVEGEWDMSFAGMPQGSVTFDKGKVTNPWKEPWTYEVKDKKVILSTATSGMHGIVITEVTAKTMKGTDGIGRVIDFKKKD